MHDQMITTAAAWIMPTHTGTEALAFILRWIHLLAGITWVGLLYFFNLVNVAFMKQVDAGSKPKIFQYLTMPALQLFRWSAMLRYSWVSGTGRRFTWPPTPSGWAWAQAAPSGCFC
jgi:uncharacterized membrane protein